MSKFDELFEFRLARYDEIDEIMRFIGDYWPKKGNILSTNRKFFEYEFCNNGRVGYYLAKDKITGEIAAGMGIYYYTERFISGQSACSGGMSLANPNIKVPFIGIEISNRFFRDLNPAIYVSPGINTKTSGPLVSKFLKHNVSRMKHFYMLNDLQEYNICKIEKKTILSATDHEQVDLKEIKSINDFDSYFDEDYYKLCRPYKDRWYINKRYFNHPVYKYNLLGITNKSVLVTKEVCVNNSKVLRIIDILGDVNEISKAGKALQLLLKRNNYEYVDVYELMVDDEKLIAAGFVERSENDCNIIPNYFEPFVQQNIEIYAHRNDVNAVCFKGDGDQDRPNFVP